MRHTLHQIAISFVSYVGSGNFGAGLGSGRCNEALLVNLDPNPKLMNADTNLVSEKRTRDVKLSNSTRLETAHISRLPISLREGII